MHPADLTTVVQPGEVTLGELIEPLRRRKGVVAASLLGCLAIALAYLVLATPRYEIEFRVDQPNASETVELNVGRTAATGLPAYTTEQVFGYFLRELRSDRAFQRFFREIYLPSLDDDQRSAPEARLYKRARKLLEVRPPDPKGKSRGLYEVRVAADDPEKVRDWTQRFLRQVVAAARTALMQDVRAGIDVAIRNAEQDLEELRHTAQTRRTDRARQLEEALVVARAIDLRDPQMTVARPPSSDKVSPFVDGSTLYARGVKSLSAELGVLKQRESDDPFIGGLRDTESRLRMWRATLAYEPKAFRIYRIDGEVIVPADPVSPRPALVLALATLLGAMAGVFAAWIVEAWSKARRIPQATLRAASQ